MVDISIVNGIINQLITWGHHLVGFTTFILRSIISVWLFLGNHQKSVDHDVPSETWQFLGIPVCGPYWLVVQFHHLETYEFVNGKDDIPYIIIYYGKCLKPPTNI